MAVAAIVAARDMRQHAHLRRRQRAVGNGDPQHVGVQLQIDAVHQPQRLELVFRQFARQPARDLIAKFRDALGDQRPVQFVVLIHDARMVLLNARATAPKRDRRPGDADALAQIAGPNATVRLRPDRRDIGTDRTHAVSGGRREQRARRVERGRDRRFVEIGRPAAMMRCGAPPRHRWCDWRSRRSGPLIFSFCCRGDVMLRPR